MVVGRWVLGRMVMATAMECDRITRGDGVAMTSGAMVVACMLSDGGKVWFVVVGGQSGDKAIIEC